MTQALYFKPSYERLKERIEKVAPNLDVALYQDGRFFIGEQEVHQQELNPEYFWMHGELFKAKETLTYFELIQQFPSAKWLHTMHTGLDVLPYQTLLDKGITISNNHSQAIAIAEYVFGQVLTHMQGIEVFKQHQQEKIWKYRPFKEVSGSHWLIVGFGHIGQEIARRAKAFGIEVTGVRRSTDNAGLADHLIPLAQINSTLPAADVVVLACSSNSQTQGLVNQEFLAKMKEGSVLVNIARGDLIVEPDLKLALDKGIPGFAILDVFKQEPVAQDSWLWQHPKVALTPHCSNAGSGMLSRSDDLFIENLERMLKKQKLRNQVNEQHIN